MGRCEMMKVMQKSSESTKRARRRLCRFGAALPFSKQLYKPWLDFSLFPPSCLEKRSGEKENVNPGSLNTSHEFAPSGYYCVAQVGFTCS